MAKKLICFGLCIIFLIFLSGCQQQKTEKITIKTNISEINLNIELADSSSEWQEGLMYRESLGEDEGMLFVFPDEDYRSFWMKNTLIPLDLLFISSNGTIVDMKESFQPCRIEFCESYKSREKAMYVLEVNGGFAAENGIYIGDYVNIIKIRQSPN